MKHFFLVCLWLLITATTYAQKPTDEVWVAIRFAHKGEGQPPGEYYGTLDYQTFEGLISKVATQGFLELKNVSWVDDDTGKIIPLSDACATPDAKYGYSRTMYLRIETISRLVLLDMKFVQSNLINSPKE